MHARQKTQSGAYTSAEARFPSSIADAKRERRGCLTKASNNAQGALHKISNDGASCGIQSYARIAEAHSTMMQTRRAQRLDTDSARQRLDDAHNATKAPNAAQNSKRHARWTNADTQKPQGSHFASAQITQINFARLD